MQTFPPQIHGLHTCYWQSVSFPSTLQWLILALWFSWILPPSLSAANLAWDKLNTVSLTLPLCSSTSIRLSLPSSSQRMWSIPLLQTNLSLFPIPRPGPTSSGLFHLSFSTGSSTYKHAQGTHHKQMRTVCAFVPPKYHSCLNPFLTQTSNLLFALQLAAVKVFFPYHSDLSVFLSDKSTLTLARLDGHFPVLSVPWLLSCCRYRWLLIPSL